MRACISIHSALRHSRLLVGVALLGLLASANAFASESRASQAQAMLLAPALELPSLEASAEAERIVEDDVPQPRARLLISEVDDQTHLGVLLAPPPGCPFFAAPFLSSLHFLVRANPTPYLLGVMLACAVHQVGRGSTPSPNLI